MNLIHGLFGVSILTAIQNCKSTVVSVVYGTRTRKNFILLDKSTKHFDNIEHDMYVFFYVSKHDDCIDNILQI